MLSTSARDELVQVPPDRSGELPEPPQGIAVDAGTQLDLTDAAMENDIDAQVAAAKFVDDDNSTMPEPEPVPARASVACFRRPGDRCGCCNDGSRSIPR